MGDFTTADAIGVWEEINNYITGWHKVVDAGNDGDEPKLRGLTGRIFKEAWAEKEMGSGIGARAWIAPETRERPGVYVAVEHLWTQSLKDRSAGVGKEFKAWNSVGYWASLGAVAVDMYEEQLKKPDLIAPPLQPANAFVQYQERKSNRDRRTATLCFLCMEILRLVNKCASARLEFYLMVIDDGLEMATSAWDRTVYKTYVAQDSDIGRTRRMLKDAMEVAKLKAMTKAMAEASVARKVAGSAMNDGLSSDRS